MQASSPLNPTDTRPLSLGWASENGYAKRTLVFATRSAVSTRHIRYGRSRNIQPTDRTTELCKPSPPTTQPGPDRGLVAHSDLRR